ALVFVLACSGSSAVGGTTSDQACTDAANTVCQRFQTCSAAAISSFYGDLGTCQSRAQAKCKLDLAAPDTGNTPDKLQACLAKYPQLTCGQLFAADFPPECQPPAGARAAGAPCGADAQCQSAFCSIDANAVCGTCQTPPVAGAPCLGSRCGPGLT